MDGNNNEFGRGLENFRRLIRQTRRRFFYRAALEATTTSALLASFTGTVFAIVLALCDVAPPAPSAFFGAVFAIACVATLLLLFLTDYDRRASEKAIDARYSLDDRCLTASDVLKQTQGREPTAIERLQLEDCFARVESIRPSDVLALKPKRAKTKTVALCVGVIALTTAVWKPFASQAAVGEPNETVVEVLRELRENVAPAIRELAQEHPEDAKLQELTGKVDAWIDEIDASSDDPKKATATVARMEREIQKTVDSYDVEGTERALKSLGEAFGEIDETSKVGEALVEGDYEKAADELEKLDFKKMSVRDRQALANKLKAAAETIRSRKDEQAAQLTEQLAEELQSGKCASCQNTSCKLAGKLRAHKSNKDKAKQLNCQLARLGLCKSNCAGACATCEANCPSKPQSQSGQGKGQKSASGSSGGSNERPLGASPTVAADPLGGDDAQLQTTRNLTQVEGQEGLEGESTKEIIRSDEPTQNQEAQRVRDDKEREFEKQIEAAMDAEEIPLERRRVVRDYFESIRASEASDVEP